MQPSVSCQCHLFLFAPELECGVEKPSGSCGGCFFFKENISYLDIIFLSWSSDVLNCF